MSSIQETEVVLTTRGRERLQSRLDRALARERELDTQIAASAEGREDDVRARARLRAEIHDLTRTLAHPTMITDVDEDPRIVELGDEVDVEFGPGDVETYVLVHPVEASTDEASISVDSPLSKALLGHRVGETVTVQAPDGAYTCTIRARRRSD